MSTTNFQPKFTPETFVLVFYPGLSKSSTFTPTGFAVSSRYGNFSPEVVTKLCEENKKAKKTHTGTIGDFLVTFVSPFCSVRSKPK